MRITVRMITAKPAVGGDPYQVHVVTGAPVGENIYDYSGCSNCSMSKTVQLDDETYEALKSYKVGGLTFDQVIRRLLEKEDPEAFQR